MPARLSPPPAPSPDCRRRTVHRTNRRLVPLAEHSGPNHPQQARQGGPAPARPPSLNPLRAHRKPRAIGARITRAEDRQEGPTAWPRPSHAHGYPCNRHCGNCGTAEADDSGGQRTAAHTGPTAEGAADAAERPRPQRPPASAAVQPARRHRCRSVARVPHGSALALSLSPFRRAKRTPPQRPTRAPRVTSGDQSPESASREDFTRYTITPSAPGGLALQV